MAGDAGPFRCSMDDAELTAHLADIDDSLTISDSDSPASPPAPVKRPAGYSKCYAPGCENKTNQIPKHAFFTFPTEVLRRAQWMQALGIEEASHVGKSSMLCDRHFKKEFISWNRHRVRLVGVAVPTEHLGPSPLPIDTSPPPSTDKAERAEQATGDPELDAQDIDMEAHPEHASTDSSNRTHEDTGDQSRGIVGPSADGIRETRQIPDAIEANLSTDDRTEPSRESAGPNESTRKSTRKIKRQAIDADYDTAPRTSAQQTTTEAEQLLQLKTLCGKFLSPDFAAIASVQARGRACPAPDSDERAFAALRAYHRSPGTYRLLRDALGLPPVAALRRALRPADSRMDARLARVLRTRLSDLPLEARVCSVCVGTTPLTSALFYEIRRDSIAGFDEMDGECRAQPAHAALVIEARGVLSDWRQPVAYCLLAAPDPREVRLWVDIALAELSTAGLHVRALVTEHDARFVTEGRDVTPETPYFVVDDHKVFCFYDPSHLLRSFRNAFTRCDFRFEGLRASWQHVEALYDYDVRRSIRLAPHLGPMTVRPTRESRRCPLLAQQAVSLATARALAAARDLGAVPEEAAGTAQLLTTMANLHSMLLGSTSTEKSALDLKFLESIPPLLAKLRTVDPHSGLDVRPPSFVEGYSVTITAFLRLNRRLGRTGVLSTARFTTTPLDDFFRELSKKRRPTARALVAAFRRRFVRLALTPPVRCVRANKLREFLQLADECLATEPGTATPATGAAAPDSLPEETETVKRSDYAEKLKVLNELPLREVARWLLVQSCTRSPCAACSSKGAPEASVDSPAVQEGAARLVARMEEQFRGYMSSEGACGRVLGPLLREVAGAWFAVPCACFSLRYFKALFLRLRIANFIAFHNRRIRRSARGCGDFTLNVLFQEDLDENGRYKI